MKTCPHCSIPNLDDAVACSSCGMGLPEVVAVPVDEVDVTGGLIPYKNPKALIAYYLGILSGIPIIGLPIGIAAFVLGILGLRDKKRKPAIRGGIHAGIGIGCGLIFTLLWGLVIVVGIIGVLAEAGR